MQVSPKTDSMLLPHAERASSMLSVFGMVIILQRVHLHAGYNCSTESRARAVDRARATEMLFVHRSDADCCAKLGRNAHHFRPGLVSIPREG